MQFDEIQAYLIMALIGWLHATTLIETVAFVGAGWFGLYVISLLQ